ncbi:GNAT family N-acetyltransferase [Vitiosangium sp. GDMCC 1.1324]|uniref:GNAT family N-acetyltransferase n=1 Tax=Vitiosangium sp. (strain GDMCC 1.1324) TaxID=2138576 RepID=UPI000D3521DA|nr:GNAT family N-acetyltransferase [Vitiosangium sp. GDMCC 1.1324]PTL85060.1 N-acetyltransferase [Vitiosangium sp. GDMCC 1.1324]
MTLTIRPARTEDAPALGRMGAALVRLHHSYDPERFMTPEEDLESGYRWWLSRELKRQGAVVLVAERDGRVVGYAYATVEARDWNALRDEHGELHDVWVDESERGSGVGAQLAEEMIRRLRAQGVPRVMLMTAAKNDAAQRLFARLGWRTTMVEMTRELKDSETD